MRAGLVVTGAVIVAVTIQVTAAENQPRPWAFNAPEREGYSIRLDSVMPAPGTQLVQGTDVTFRVTLSYKLSIADHGKVILVFQQENGEPVDSKAPQVSKDVTVGEGVVELEQVIRVPSDGKELWLFIPLVPDSLTNTGGEVTLRYPLVMHH